MRSRFIPASALLALATLACSQKDPREQKEPAPAAATNKPAAVSSAEPTSAKLDLGRAPAAVLAEPPKPESLTGKTVLHVGDSMVGGSWGLTRALEAKLTAEGAKLVRHTKVSETVSSFDKGSALRDLLARHHPDIVILNLGTNDVFVPYPQAYADNVQNIAKRIAPRQCWWIGPPTWKPDTGIVKIIKENSGTCRFFDSSTLKLERASDGIHPTDKGGAEWADKFWVAFRTPATSELSGALAPR